MSSITSLSSLSLESLQLLRPADLPTSTSRSQRLSDGGDPLGAGPLTAHGSDSSFGKNSNSNSNSSINVPIITSKRLDLHLQYSPRPLEELQGYLRESGHHVEHLAVNGYVTCSSSWTGSIASSTTSRNPNQSDQEDRPGGVLAESSSQPLFLSWSLPARPTTMARIHSLIDGGGGAVGTNITEFKAVTAVEAADLRPYHQLNGILRAAWGALPRLKHLQLHYAIFDARILAALLLQQPSQLKCLTLANLDWSPHEATIVAKALAKPNSCPLE